MAQRLEELKNAYTTIGEANAGAWQQINQAMGGLVKILNAYRRNQQRFLRRQRGIQQQHEQIIALLGDIQEQVRSLKKKMEEK